MLIVAYAHFVWLGMRNNLPMFLVGIAILFMYSASIEAFNRPDIVAVGLATVVAIWVLGSIAMMTSILIFLFVIGQLPLSEYRTASTVHEIVDVNKRIWNRFWVRKK